MPDSAHLVPGGVVELTAMPLGESGAPLPERARRVRWSMEDVAVADFELTGTVGRLEAREVGTAVVRVELGQGEASASVYIHPPELASIVIEPSPIEGPPLVRIEARAVLLDADGHEIPPDGFRISWSVADTVMTFVGGATSPEVGLFNRTPGRNGLTLVVNDLRTSTEIIVH